MSIGNIMNLAELVKRLKLKYKIVKGLNKGDYMIYAVIESNGYQPYPSLRPAYDEEIMECKRKQSIAEVLKANK